MSDTALSHMTGVRHLVFIASNVGEINQATSAK